MSDQLNTINKILGVYALFLVIFGTIGNTFTCMICLKKNLRAVPTFVFLSFMVITDTISLYFWNLNHFVSNFYGYVIDGINIHLCRLFIFLQLFSFQASSWLLVTMAFERFLSVKIKNWRSTVLNTKKSVLIASIVVAVVFSVNFHLVFTVNYEMPLNKTYDGGCYSDRMHQIWQQVHIYLYSLIPFGLLVISNILLIYQTVLKKSIRNVSNTSNNSNNKKKQMSLSIVVITISFIVLTLPTTIAGGYFLDELLSSEKGYVILLLCDSLAFSYHAINFIVFLIVNKQFSREFRNTINWLLNKNRVDVEFTRTNSLAFTKRTQTNNN